MKKKKKKKDWHWVQNRDIAPPAVTWEPKAGPRNNLSPVELFNLFFDDDLITMIVTYSNQYAAKKNKTGDITSEEMRTFVGILLLSGYVPLPRRKLFWQSQPDTHNEMVSKAMSRDRFDFIMSNLHFCDNDNLNADDKFSKIRLLFRELNSRFQSFAPHEEHHSVDETMVPYFGRHGCKQFIRGKPIRWGYKLWTGATPTGYVVWSEPYQGKKAVGFEYGEFGLGGNVILNYTEVLQEQGNFNFHIFFDNFFTSVHLLDELRKKNIRGTGTIRENRLANCPVLKKASLKKTERGTMAYASDTESNIIICAWNDNSIVTLGSNAVPVEPTKTVSRYSSKLKKKISVQQPNSIACYNSYMGGVDRSDENISHYRIAIRGKKWYSSLAQYLIDAAEHNAWQLHRLQGGKSDHLNFRRAIVQDLLKERNPLSNRKCRASRLEQSSSARYDGMDHYVMDQGKQTRCGVCHKNATTKCRKCEKALHTKCFLQYHVRLE